MKSAKSKVPRKTRTTTKTAPARKAPATPAGEPARFATIQIPVSIAASVDRVWTALIHETASWWTGDFVTTGPGGRFVIEPRVGGRMFEERVGDRDGRGLQWATVLRFEPPRASKACLEFAGDIFPEWGGPVRTQVSIRLEAEGSGTRLTLRDALVGNVTTSIFGALESGWKELIGRMFKTHVEGRRSG